MILKKGAGMVAVLVRSMDRDGIPKVFSSSSNIVGWQRPKFAKFVLKSFFCLKKAHFSAKNHFLNL